MLINISDTWTAVQETHQKRRLVTLEHAEDGVIGSHGVSVQCLVGGGSGNVIDSVVLWTGTQTHVLETQMRPRTVIMDRAHSGVAGRDGASARLLVVVE